MLRLEGDALEAAKKRSGAAARFKKAVTGGDSEGKLIRTNTDAAVDKDASRLWIDASGLVADEMYPQHKHVAAADRPAMNTFVKMDDYMLQKHPEIDVMMLTVVAGVSKPRCIDYYRSVPPR